MKQLALLLVGALLSAPIVTAAQDVGAAEALLKKSGCTKCHSVSAKKEGPSFKETAAKYKGKADAEATLTAKISGGKDHPAVKAGADDVKSLVKWVLSL